MKQITLRLPLRLLAELEREARAAGVSRSEHMRDVLASRRDTPRDAPDLEREAELTQRITELEQQLEAKENQMQVLAEAYQDQKQTVNELKVYQEREDRGAIGRLKYVLFGRDRGE